MTATETLFRRDGRPLKSTLDAIVRACRFEYGNGITVEVGVRRTTRPIGVRSHYLSANVLRWGTDEHGTHVDLSEILPLADSFTLADAVGGCIVLDCYVYELERGERGDLLGNAQIVLGPEGGVNWAGYADLGELARDAASYSDLGMGAYALAELERWSEETAEQEHDNGHDGGVSRFPDCHWCKLAASPPTTAKQDEEHARGIRYIDHCAACAEGVPMREGGHNGRHTAEGPEQVARESVPGGDEPEQIAGIVTSAYEPIDDLDAPILRDIRTAPGRLESAGKIEGGEVVRTVDLTPSPVTYRAMLAVIIESSTVEDDRVWARAELERVRGVEAWTAPGWSEAPGEDDRPLTCECGAPRASDPNAARGWRYACADPAPAEPVHWAPELDNLAAPESEREALACGDRPHLGTLRVANGREATCEACLAESGAPSVNDLSESALSRQFDA